MKKYSTPAYIDGENGETVFGSVDVYLASEVDAYRAVWLREHEEKDARIAELGQALRDVIDSETRIRHGYPDLSFVRSEALARARKLMDGCAHEP